MILEQIKNVNFFLGGMANEKTNNSYKCDAHCVTINTMFGSRNLNVERKENGVENSFSCLVGEENWKEKKMRRQM